MEKNVDEALKQYEELRANEIASHQKKIEQNKQKEITTFSMYDTIIDKLNAVPETNIPPSKERDTCAQPSTTAPPPSPVICNIPTPVSQEDTQPLSGSPHKSNRKVLLSERKPSPSDKTGSKLEPQDAQSGDFVSPSSQPRVVNETQEEKCPSILYHDPDPQRKSNEGPLRIADDNCVLDGMRGNKRVLACAAFEPGSCITEDKPWLCTRVVQTEDGTLSTSATKLLRDPMSGQVRYEMITLFAEELLIRDYRAEHLYAMGYTEMIDDEASVYTCLTHSGVIQHLVDAYKHKASAENISTLVRICLAYVINIHVHATPSMRTGCALFDTPMAWCNSSCSPNARHVTQQDGTTRLVAITKIAQGEEVTVPHNIVVDRLDAVTRPIVYYTVLGFECRCCFCEAEAAVLHAHVQDILRARQTANCNEDATTGTHVRHDNNAITPGRAALAYKQTLPVRQSDPVFPNSLARVPSVVSMCHNYQEVCGGSRGIADVVESNRRALELATRTLSAVPLGETLIRTLEDMGPVLTASDTSPFYLDPRLLSHVVETLCEAFIASDASTVATEWLTPCRSVCAMNLLTRSERQLIKQTPLGDPSAKNMSVGGCVEDTARMKMTVTNKANRARKHAKGRKKQAHQSVPPSDAYYVAMQAACKKFAVPTICMVFFSALAKAESASSLAHIERSKTSNGSWPSPSGFESDTLRTIGLFGAYCVGHQVMMNVNEDSDKKNNEKNNNNNDNDNNENSNDKNSNNKDNSTKYRIFFTQMVKFSNLMLSGVPSTVAVELMAGDSSLSALIKKHIDHMVSTVESSAWQKEAIGAEKSLDEKEDDFIEATKQTTK
jgi:hypothetical protein